MGFSVLIGISSARIRLRRRSPRKSSAPDGSLVFTGADIRAGQEVFLKYGLMENGTIWGHGAYLGPDFSAEYLHTLGEASTAALRASCYNKAPDALTPEEKAVVEAQVARLLKQNRYDPGPRR